ncbi:MAG: hypothetical protein NZ990_19440 [Myxococcota bacterium]|nr:hypothetical protein [Myxococcota bacterium]
MRDRYRRTVDRGQASARSGRAARLALVLALGAGILVYLGCATRGFSPEGSRAARVTDALGTGDAARRASVRLVVEGLEADHEGSLRRAQGSYERAIQVDPTNPYAYLALARHHLDGGDPLEAGNFIDQSAALFEAEGLSSPGVNAHLIGLRGWAFEVQGRGAEAGLYSERAASLAPEVWGDGYLAPGELR